MEGLAPCRPVAFCSWPPHGCDVGVLFHVANHTLSFHRIGSGAVQILLRIFDSWHCPSPLPTRRIGLHHLRFPVFVVRFQTSATKSPNFLRNRGPLHPSSPLVLHGPRGSVPSCTSPRCQEHTRMDVVLGNAVLEDVTQSSPNHVPVVSVPHIGRAFGVHTTTTLPPLPSSCVAVPIRGMIGSSTKQFVRPFTCQPRLSAADDPRCDATPYQRSRPNAEQDRVVREETVHCRTCQIASLRFSHVKLLERIAEIEREKLNAFLSCWPSVS